MNRTLSIVAIVVALLAMIGEWAGLRLPSIAWLFSFGPKIGWVLASVILAGGLAGLLLLPRHIHWTPITLQRFRRFRQLRRGWWSFCILLFLIFLALLDQTLVGKRALVVRYEGKTYFPAFVKEIYPGKTFGQGGDQETNYRTLQASLKVKKSESKGWVIMPLIPWDAVLDSDSFQTVNLADRDGKLFDTATNQPFSGRAHRFYEDAPTVKCQEARFRNGVLDGELQGFTKSGALVVNASYSAGVKQRERITGEMPLAEFDKVAATPWGSTLYPPIRPLAEAKHYLGTDSKGWDIVAHIYGGWQVNLKAVVLYLLITYSVGVLIGVLMGYLGGIFDLFFQRVIEIIEQLPFLYIVMIVVSIVTVAEMNLGILLGVICLFSWTSLTYTLRALAYKEKERDYIAAARLQGASTWRILTRYLLPNMLATIITVIPFSVSGIIASLTALSFLGFGLPPEYPSWGWLFDDGTNNLSYLWIATSVFVAMVAVLLLVTFVGEALREAFDPKKFSTYQ